MRRSAVLFLGTALLLPVAVEAQSPSADPTRPADSPSVTAGSWASADGLHGPHDGPMALLPDGRVLVGGGGVPDAYGDPVRTLAQVYDPLSQTSTALGSVTPAGDYTMTVLDDGRVLLAGYDGIQHIKRIPERDASVVLDPMTGTTTPVHLAIPRNGQTATLLPDGRVLIAGGFGGGPTYGSTASAELFDPVTMTSTPTGDLVHDRAGAATAPLPDGRVLIVGGRTWQIQDGSAQALFVEEDEIYDPRTGTSSPVSGAKPTGGTLVLAGGRVLLIDPAADAVADITPFPGFGMGCDVEGAVCRDSNSATMLRDGDVLLAGGYRSSTSADASPFVDNAEVFDPLTGVVVETDPMLTPRRGHAAFLRPDDQVLILGGRDPYDQPVDTVEYYVP